MLGPYINVHSLLPLIIINILSASPLSILQALCLLWQCGANAGPNRMHSLSAALVSASGAGYMSVAELLLSW